jgi:hypothetical protein
LEHLDTLAAVWRSGCALMLPSSGAPNRGNARPPLHANEPQFLPGSKPAPM